MCSQRRGDAFGSAIGSPGLFPFRISRNDGHRENFVDAAAIQVDDLEASAARLEGIPDQWYPLKLEDHATGQGGEVVGIGDFRKFEALEGLSRRHHADDEKRAVRALDHVRLLARLRHVARDRLQEVGLRDDALEAAVLVATTAMRIGWL